MQIILTESRKSSPWGWERAEMGYCKGAPENTFGGDMFIILIAMMVLQVHGMCQLYQIIHFKCVYIIIC